MTPCTLIDALHLNINLRLNLYWSENLNSRGNLFHFAPRGVLQCSVSKTANRYDADYKLWQSEVNLYKAYGAAPLQMSMLLIFKRRSRECPLMSFVSDACAEHVRETFIHCLYEWSESWKFIKPHPSVRMRLTFEIVTSQDTQFISLFAPIFFSSLAYGQKQKHVLY
jgi:hypothetical protein